MKKATNEEIPRFDLYYPPEVENLDYIGDQVSICVEAKLPTNLEILINDLTLVADWCFNQNPQRSKEGSVYLAVIQNANRHAEELRAALRPDGLHVYPS